MVKAVLGILSGFVSGTMAGAFGVGGAILTTPAVQGVSIYEDGIIPVEELWLKK